MLFVGSLSSVHAARMVFVRLSPIRLFIAFGTVDIAGWLQLDGEMHRAETHGHRREIPPKFPSEYVDNTPPFVYNAQVFKQMTYV